MVKWSCLTGMAQMSIVLSILFDLTQNDKYRDAARVLNRFLRARQRIRAAVPDVRGGIAGSYPVNAEYQPYRMLNGPLSFSWTRYCMSVIRHSAIQAIIMQDEKEQAG